MLRFAERAVCDPVWSHLFFPYSFTPLKLHHLSLFQMKRSRRPIFIIFIVILICTLMLVSNATLRGNCIFPTRASTAIGASSFHVVSNETLLSYAAVELGVSVSRQHINELLEWSSPQGRYRSISSWKDNVGDKLHSRRGRIPVQLMNPKYAGLWPEFQKSLGNWVRRKLFQPNVMQEMMSLVKDPVDRHYGLPQGKNKYPSCAVVGNSGILLKKNYGTFIDSHAAVIRLNNARTAGFHIEVGSKTTISFINSNILHLCARRAGCFCHPYGDTVPMVMYICQPVHFMDFVLCNRSHIAPLIITDARFDMLCARIAKYYSLKLFAETTGRSLDEWSLTHGGEMFHYSSGMQAIMLALGLCEKVSVFGFGKSSNAKHHYHTNQKAELHLHDYEAEYTFYKDLMERPSSIPFLRGSKFKIPPVTMYN